MGVALDINLLTPRTLTPAVSPGKLSDGEIEVGAEACKGGAGDHDLNDQVGAEACKGGAGDHDLNDQAAQWLPTAGVQPGRTARQRAQDVIERHRHWSTAVGGIPDHPRFEGWNPQQHATDEPDMGSD